jgi:hypothetical protein
MNGVLRQLREKQVCIIRSGLVEIPIPRDLPPPGSSIRIIFTCGANRNPLVSKDKYVGEALHAEGRDRAWHCNR